MCQVQIGRSWVKLTVLGQMDGLGSNWTVLTKLEDLESSNYVESL